MRIWAKRVAIGLALLLAVLLLWGLVEPYSINEHREEAFLPDLPAEWEGREVAVIADFQLGMWAANTGTLYRIVRRLVEGPPAVVLIAGDFVYMADDRLDELPAKAAEMVAPLTRAGIPTFAVLGNHDYSMDYRDDPVNPRVAAAVRRELERVGVRVLENDVVGLRAREGGSGSLYIVGIGDEWAGKDRPAEAVAAVPDDAPRVVFMHNPHSFLELPDSTAPLAVAAHTHGGQIALPFAPHWSWMSLVKRDPVEADGWAPDADDAAGNRLYVNVGIGFSDLPIRINARPELTRFVLRRGAPSRP